MLAASINNTSPPEPVTANPVAMPGVSVRSATSEWKRARPRYLRTSSVPIVVGRACSAPSTLVATLRSSLPIWRSRPRTPASRVWPSTMVSNASSLNATSAASRPLRSSSVHDAQVRCEPFGSTTAGSSPPRGYSTKCMSRPSLSSSSASVHDRRSTRRFSPAVVTTARVTLLIPNRSS